MSKVIGQMIAYYGLDHIQYALRSIAPFVDHTYVFLTDQPSHGTPSPFPCPDTPEQMEEAILGVGLGDKLTIIKGRWPNEGAHRDAVYEYTQTGDLIVVVDADEIWRAEQLEAGIVAMKASSAQFYKVRLSTLWRSFNWICTDPMMPDRIIKVGGQGIQYSDASKLPSEPDVWHFGYARSAKDVVWKMSIHGHASSIFPNWFENKFLGWRPGNGVTDCHPDCGGFWFPSPFDKALLPEDLKSHPYYYLEIIE